VALLTVEVTGTFTDGSGEPLAGTATFTPTSTVYAGGVPVLQPDAPVTAQITDGQLKAPSGDPLTLTATDNDGLTVEGLTGWWAWNAQVTVSGQVQPPWSFFLPYSSSPVDLTSLVNSPASGGGSGTVTSVNHVDPDGSGNVTLTAAQVGADASGAAAAALSAAETYAAGVASAAQSNAETYAAAQASAAQSAAEAASDPAGAAATAQANAETYAAGAVSAETTRAETAEGLLIPLTQRGANSGVATLDTGGHVPTGQLPAATTGAQGAVQLDGTAGDIQPVGTAAAAGSVGKVADAGHVHAGLSKVTATPLAGYTLVNGTGTVSGMTWTSPNDGQMHMILVTANIDVTSNETGGAIGVSLTSPNGVTHVPGVYAAGLSAGFAYFTMAYFVEPNTTVTLQQTTALTAGAATLWAAIWAL
jgi:hypothetical protein